MHTPPPDPPRWPERLTRATATLEHAAPSARDAARAEVWKVLHAALFASLRAQAHRVPMASREDLEDIASAKALELLTRAEERTWTPAGRSAHEVGGFVARVARNGLIDLARRRGREVAAPEDDDAWQERLSMMGHADVPTPEDLTSAREYVGALRVCVGELAPRSRVAWFHRVFLEASSREIAARCEVQPAHVDVLVQRARLALRTCMKHKGHEDADTRPGVFAALWPEGLQHGLELDRGKAARSDAGS